MIAKRQEIALAGFNTPLIIHPLGDRADNYGDCPMDLIWLAEYLDICITYGSLSAQQFKSLFFPQSAARGSAFVTTPDSYPPAGPQAMTAFSFGNWHGLVISRKRGYFAEAGGNRSMEIRSRLRLRSGYRTSRMPVGGRDE